jgi:hypothetical protein
MYQILQQVGKICVAFTRNLQEQIKKFLSNEDMAANISTLAPFPIENTPIRPCPDARSC